MIKKIKLFLLCLFSISTLSSCFDVIEEINMQTNGSGQIKGTLNLSKSRVKVASLMKLDKVDGFKVPSEAEIRKEMNVIVDLLKKTKGISNVKSHLDFNNFIASISCDFQNVQALNAYTKTLSTHFKTKINNYSSYSYDATNRVLIRNFQHSTDAKKEFDKLKPENQKSFQDAFYTSIYRFENLVQKQDNTLAKVSPNKKAVMLKVAIPTLVLGKANLSNKITLTK